jgi:hypothetical protein
VECGHNGGSASLEEPKARLVDRLTHHTDTTHAPDDSESERAEETTGATETAGASETETAAIARARLEGVTLAAREIAHLLNNDLCVIFGNLELLQADPDLPASLEQLIADALARAEAAADKIEKLRRIRRVVLKETPFGPSLDLERSQ